jgi:hypothetical protein
MFCVTSSHLDQKSTSVSKVTRKILSSYEMTDSVLNNKINNKNLLHNNYILRFNNVLLFKVYDLEFMLN